MRAEYQVRLRPPSEWALELPGGEWVAVLVLPKRPRAKQVTAAIAARMTLSPEVIRVERQRGRPRWFKVVLETDSLVRA